VWSGRPRPRTQTTEQLPRVIDRGSADRVHIAEIDFEDFYRPTFPDEASSRQFSDRVEHVPEAQRTAKIVFHQAARLVWLGDRINEIAAGRPALQILFYMIAAETVAKLTYGFEGRDQSSRYVHVFFEKLSNKVDQDSLAHAFCESPTRRPIGLKRAVKLLYDVRCDVAHRGMYYVFQLPLDESDLPLLVYLGGVTIETNFTLNLLRNIVLRGARRASSMIMGDEPLPPI
jgi:hypothetical protein